MIYDLRFMNGKRRLRALRKIINHESNAAAAAFPEIENHKS